MESTATIEWNKDSNGQDMKDIRFTSDESTVRTPNSLITGGGLLESPYKLTLEQCQTANQPIGH